MRIDPKPAQTCSRIHGIVDREGGGWLPTPGGGMGPGVAT